MTVFSYGEFDGTLEKFILRPRNLLLVEASQVGLGRCRHFENKFSENPTSKCSTNSSERSRVEIFYAVIEFSYRRFDSTNEKFILRLKN